MATKKKRASKVRSKTGKPARKKAAKKKTLKKRTAAKKVSGKRSAKKTAAKKTAKKKAAKKTAVRKALRKKTAAPKQGTAGKTVLVKPGPPSGSVPPVEEPARQEEAVGVITHYYSHLGVAVMQLNKGTVRSGDTIHIKGHSTDFTQKVESMEYEHQHVDQAGAGQSVGLKVIDHAREHDIVYRVL